MEATITIAQFGSLFQSKEEEDGALLKVVRQLQSVLKTVEIEGWWGGQQPTSLAWSGWV